jgi:lipid-binding SYLF domain-containing protein
MMNKSMQKGALAVLVLSLSYFTFNALAGDGLEGAADGTIKTLISADPALTNLFDCSAGYAVFPGAGKGGVVFGGLHGKGLVYEHGKPIGRATVNQFSFGLQLGGQSFDEVIFFEDADALARFKKAPFETCAELSAIAVTEGASLNPRYREGFVVYAVPRAGLMAQTAVGVQKFKYHPFSQETATK